MVRKRIEWIDVVRCIGMAMIIIGHTYATGFWQNFIFVINVPIFFVLSGYLTRSKTIKETIKGGFRTLLIPYFITVAMTVLVAFISHYRFLNLVVNLSWKQWIIAGMYGIGTASSQTIVHNYTMPAIGAIWFLPAMFLGNIIFQLLLKVINKSRNVNLS